MKRVSVLFREASSARVYERANNVYLKGPLLCVMFPGQPSFGRAGRGGKVSVLLRASSQPKVHERVSLVYTEGDALLCVETKSAGGRKKTYKYPIASVFRLEEDYGDGVHVVHKYPLGEIFRVEEE
jgi:hypothetical protein